MDIQDSQISVLITGAAGFVGSAMASHLINNTSWSVVCVDKLNYASKDWSRLEVYEVLNNPRLRTITWDLQIPFSEELKYELKETNIIIHMAAESHVDNSIKDPVFCIKNNIDSTINILEFARTLKNLKIFENFSTDEVFGTCHKGQAPFKESDCHYPGNPYAASKSCAESIVIGYSFVYKIPIICTNLMNIFGPLQLQEKFTTMTIRKILEDETIQIHTNDEGVPGSRFYVYVDDVCQAVLFLLQFGKTGERYNVPGYCERNNLEYAQQIASIIGKPLKYELVSQTESRPYVDFRYCLDGSKIFNLGFKFKYDFDSRLRHTVEWTLKNKEWLYR